MCGRFYVDPEDEYFRELAGRISSSPLTDRFCGKVPANADGEYGGEVVPTSVVPVLAPNRAGEQTVFPMQWGYTLPASGDRKPPLIINARSETAAEKPLFRDSWRQRRCAIPATAYFEWEHRMGFDGKPKVGAKYRITPAAGERTFLAGLYRMEQGAENSQLLSAESALNIVSEALAQKKTVSVYMELGYAGVISGSEYMQITGNCNDLDFVLQNGDFESCTAVPYWFIWEPVDGLKPRMSGNYYMVNALTGELEIL